MGSLLFPMAPEKKPQLGLILSSRRLQVEQRITVNIQPLTEGERGSSGLLPFLFLLLSLNLIIKEGSYEWGGVKWSPFKIFLGRHNFVGMISFPRLVC